MAVYHLHPPNKTTFSAGFWFSALHTGAVSGQSCPPPWDSQVLTQIGSGLERASPPKGLLYSSLTQTVTITGCFSCPQGGGDPFFPCTEPCAALALQGLTEQLFWTEVLYQHRWRQNWAQCIGHSRTGNLQVQTLFRHENQGDAQLVNLPGQIQPFVLPETADRVKWWSFTPENMCDSSGDYLWLWHLLPSLYLDLRVQTFEYNVPHQYQPCRNKMKSCPWPESSVSPTRLCSTTQCKLSAPQSIAVPADNKDTVLQMGEISPIRWSSVQARQALGNTLIALKRYITNYENGRAVRHQQ